MAAEDQLVAEVEQLSLRMAAETLRRMRRDLDVAADAIGNRNWMLACAACADIGVGLRTFIPVLVSADELTIGPGRSARASEATTQLEELLAAEGMLRLPAAVDALYDELQRKVGRL